MTGQIRRTFRHDFPAPPARVWEALADTARYNEAGGLPKHRIEERVGEGGDVVFVGHARMFGLPVSWDDLPCNFLRHRWFEHGRRVHKGPIASFTATFTLEPTAGGSAGRYDLDVEPRGPLGRLVAPAFLQSGRKMFTSLAAQAERWLAGAQELPFLPPPPRLPAAALARAERIAAQLAAGDAGPELAQRLKKLVIEGPDTEVQRLRPLALAERWHVADQKAVDLCLEATRGGLLRLQWDLLCPRCRGAKATAGTLDRLPQGAHCGTCNIDYTRDFTRNVELSFAPAEAIRPVEGGEFCLLGPMSVPHILLQVTLGPGEERRFDDVIDAGPLRLRTLEAGPALELEHPGGPLPALIVGEAGMALGEIGEKPLVLRNRTGRTRTIVLEERIWRQDALTADRVMTSQTFRDLFSAEILRPGDEVAIARTTLLFSDLRASTAMYGEVGDARAYQLVREHFAFLTGIVRRFDGGVVKTIGDAVMAAFHDPVQGVAAALAMQKEVGRFNATMRHPIVLKLGLHEGPCIAVTMNERLDYFGQTANLAARLQGESRGGDVVVSKTLADQPEVAALLEAYRPTLERAPIKGFAEPVEFMRVEIDPAGELAA